jgi:hypothetical protein
MPAWSSPIEDTIPLASGLERTEVNFTNTTIYQIAILDRLAEQLHPFSAKSIS